MVTFTMTRVSSLAVYTIVYLYKNGTPVPSAESTFMKGAGSSTATFTINQQLSLEAGDYVEIWGITQVAESASTNEFKLNIFAV